MTMLCFRKSQHNKVKTTTPVLFKLGTQGTTMSTADQNSTDKEQAELLQLRTRIDALDNDILASLVQRAQCVQRVGEVKKGGPMYRPEREAQVLRNIAAKNPGPLSNEATQRIFREIMSWCLALELPQQVAYLGPQGTFSEAAATKHFGSAPDFKPQQTIDDVFHAVETGAVQYGVVPVENSTEGAINRTLDLLLASSAKICGEVSLRIRHNLMSQSGNMQEIRRIYSHTQSLSQCHNWLAHHAANIERHPVSSNAEAARLASEQPDAAAIAGENAAHLYNLQIIHAGIEDEAVNTTRFFILGKHDAGISGKDKTSLVCTIPSRPGSLHGLLVPFTEEGVNMIKLESRPSRAGLWEYVFYVDVDGHREDPAVARALAALHERAGFLKVLGSYPVAAI